MEVTLKIKDNLYKEIEKPSKDPNVEPEVYRKLIKKNVVTNITIDTNDIVTISDLLNDKGNILKNYCRLHIKEVGPIVVNHSRLYIENIKKHNAKQIGFRQRGRN